MADATVDTPSSAYTRMEPAWQMIADILAGAAAVRAKGELYLPQYPGEHGDEYDRRRKAAPWRPEFADTLRSLASKPFGQDVAFAGDVAPQFKSLADDVDARGNSQTVFARDVFRSGIADGMVAILVDYPSMTPGMTLADERAAGARPYWVQIPAASIIALYTAMIDGKEVPVHVRIKEAVVGRDGFGETVVNQVRVLEIADTGPTWQLWQETRTTTGAAYRMVDAGTISLPQIPLALFFTGERIGEHQVVPPLLDLAEMQIELYRALSRQDEILTYAGSPMLSANGFDVPEGTEILVGPKRVLTAPPGETATSWSFVQPNAANITEVRNHVASVMDDMRRLGMQPITPRSGTPTATGQSIEAAKAHTAVQAWATDFKDTLDLAWLFTAQWLGLDAARAPEVRIDTDFSIEPYAPAPLQTLQAARNSKDISLRTYWQGLQRFDVLPADFDADKEDEALTLELEGVEPDVPINPATGEELVTPPPPPPPNDGATIGGRGNSVTV